MNIYDILMGWYFYKYLHMHLGTKFKGACNLPDFDSIIRSEKRTVVSKYGIQNEKNYFKNSVNEQKLAGSQLREGVKNIQRGGGTFFFNIFTSGMKQF